MSDHKYIEDPQDIRLNENLELQQILGNPPGWLLHWGTTFIAVGLIIFLALAWFIKYPDAVPARIVLTTEQPPIRVYAETFGKLDEFRVADQETVKEGAIIAVLDNPADLNDVVILDSFLQEIQGSFSEPDLLNVQIPRGLKLGDLQTAYADFSKSFDEYNFFFKKNSTDQKVRNLRAQIQKHDRLEESLNKQLVTAQNVVALSKREIERNEQLKEIGGVTATQIEAAEEEYLRNQQEVDNLNNQIINNRLQIERARMQIIDIQEAYEDGKSMGIFNIQEDIQKIRSAIDSWKKRFLVLAPISGKVSLNKFRSSQQYINQNEELLIIVPDTNSKIIGKGMLSSVGSGKVEPDMHANIRLDAYPYQEYGMLQGKVQSISLIPQDEGFLVELSIPQPLLTTYDEPIVFQQEMQGTANIITKDRTILERIFDRVLSIIYNE